eukprot:CAMPEP_0118720788 /NCGR_PEP_ID=MMETSP0800-20121206/30318_1 /TAXON_ID=210618 ORGANISM="Striatella unipunctata, Strain CCMP2910" /NCGR_SAMPLE_ID=MMETSP0800 /ASSEMBLY_ACC=CAM_ASM_000638 /LENGTH=110 /DNA_ID=CAMNT_0006628493 /DNA_START=83 /DNA_END=412 /DNA_ORIENTATION=+
MDDLLPAEECASDDLLPIPAMDDLLDGGGVANTIEDLRSGLLVRLFASICSSCCGVVGTSTAAATIASCAGRFGSGELLGSGVMVVVGVVGLDRFLLESSLVVAYKCSVW